MKTDIQREISRNIPNDMKIKIPKDTAALLTAFDCILMERCTGSGFIYFAVNVKTGRRETIARRSSALTTSGVEAMVEKMRKSNVAGAGKYETDRPSGNGIALDNGHKQIDMVFKEMLPENGYSIRDEQISLAHHIFDAIGRRIITLAEGEVGTGKTIAYLTPTLIAKRGRLNGYCNLSFYSGSPYVDLINMPVVIATSSIALQKALIADYIPELSRLLLEYEMIKTPIKTVLRKGREHYVCESKLRNHIRYERDPQTKMVLSDLLKPSAQIDLAEIDGLTNHAKRKICVPDRCDRKCKRRSTCPYLRFREGAKSLDIDIQVCNHNYLLADILRRKEGKSPLIPNYQIVIIDEAHKFIDAAQSMYGTELSSLSLPDIREAVNHLNLKNENAGKHIRADARKLAYENENMFKRLTEHPAADEDSAENESDRSAIIIDAATMRHLRNICNISYRLMETLAAELIAGKGEGLKAQAIWELSQIHDQASEFLNHRDLICWIEKNSSENRLCAIPNNLGDRLYDDIWNKGIPIILTSGTLSAGGDFTRTKNSLGLDKVGSHRINETSKSSPFDYMKNSLIYIADDMPFPDQRDPAYIEALANRIKELVYASHGHAAVLFTSYKVMDQVYKILEKCSLPFPMFRLGKGAVREIERFKQSGNGILFAAGALWEGIDIPGDALSLLIIVKLPFPIPDPISNYERSLYDSDKKFREHYILPEAAIKSKQGYGRGFRTENDTCVVVFLDCRMEEGSYYREPILSSLPECAVTSCIGDIWRWIEDMKPSGYFTPIFK